MLKSRIFTFIESNLHRDIAEFEKSTGRIPSELQCNLNTYHIWIGLFRQQLAYPVTIEDLDDGVIALYKSIPIKINSSLDDGVIGIK